MHKRLGIKRDFTSWFKYQCKKLKLVEERDYIEVSFDSLLLMNQKSGHGGDRKSVDYITSIDIGKNLCMVSKSEKANEIRWHLIDVREPVDLFKRNAPQS